MGARIAAPDGTALGIEWDDGAQAWVCWPADEPELRVAAEDRFLEGALAEALGFEVAHDDLPGWLPAFAEHVRASCPR